MKCNVVKIKIVSVETYHFAPMVRLTDTRLSFNVRVAFKILRHVTPSHNTDVFVQILIISLAYVTVHKIQRTWLYSSPQTSAWSRKRLTKLGGGEQEAGRHPNKRDRC